MQITLDRVISVTPQNPIVLVTGNHLERLIARKSEVIFPFVLLHDQWDLRITKRTGEIDRFLTIVINEDSIHPDLGEGWKKSIPILVGHSVAGNKCGGDTGSRIHGRSLAAITATIPTMRISHKSQYGSAFIVDLENGTGRIFDSEFNRLYPVFPLEHLIQQGAGNWNEIEPGDDTSEVEAKISSGNVDSFDLRLRTDDQLGLSTPTQDVPRDPLQAQVFRAQELRAGQKPT